MHRPLLLLPLPHPFPLSKPISAPSICTCAVDDTMFRDMNQRISLIFTSGTLLYKSMDNFTRGDIYLINP